MKVSIKVEQVQNGYVVKTVVSQPNTNSSIPLDVRVTETVRVFLNSEQVIFAVKTELERNLIDK